MRYPAPHMSDPLPIDAALPELTGTLAARTAAVLVAPPGAGKTTRVPLVLAQTLEGRFAFLGEHRGLVPMASSAVLGFRDALAAGANLGLRAIDLDLQPVQAL